MLVETALRFERRANVGVQGANSVVFEAYDHQLQDVLVVKQVAKSGLDAARYFDEASRLYAVRHPNVVDVLYASSDAAHVYLAMPKYDGSVEAVLRRRPLTVREVVRVGTDFLSGLHHVHVRGLVHFDVKPSNVLLDAGSSASLTDFGLAQRVDVHGLATPSQVYESHVAPEYLTTSTALSIAADVYQAGLTLYRMCVGTVLWNAQLQSAVAQLGPNWPQAVAAGAFPARDGLPPHVPPRLRGVVERALAVDPSARYATVLDLLNDLAAVDQYLDWQFTPTTTEWSWAMDDGVHERRMALRPGAGGFDVAATRRNLTSGQTTAVRSVAAHADTWPKATKAVRTALEELTPSP